MAFVIGELAGGDGKVEIEHEGQVVGEADAGDFEADGGDVGVVADEVEFAAGGPARVGGGVEGVGALEAGGAEEHAQFPYAGEGVEVARDEAGFAAGGADEVVEFEELAVTGADAEGEVVVVEGVPEGHRATDILEGQDEVVA